MVEQSHIITPCVIITCSTFQLPELLHSIIVFLPSKIRLRNVLPNSVKSATSIAKFRQGYPKIILQIKQNLNDTTMDKEIQISINFQSNLNADLYNHNLVESSICSIFGYCYEDSFHLSFIVNVIFKYILSMILSIPNGNL